MKKQALFLFPIFGIFIALAAVYPEKNNFAKRIPVNDSLIHPSEKHFKNIRQLTFGGDNAEAYFSPDGKNIVFQKTETKKGIECDQIFFGPVDQTNFKMISSGKGRTTCSYFLNGGKSIIYASTHLGSDACPPVPDKKAIGKYVWAIYPDFDLFECDLNGKITRRITYTPGYDAEATVSPKGDKIVFTSMRTGDLELFVMNPDGTGLVQVTDKLGYDGGAFFSPDGTMLVFRASRPKTPDEVKEYKDLLKQNLVAPTKMELFVCNIDGSGMKKITSLGGANWAPYFHPSGKKIIFASNHDFPRGFPFNLYMINLDGTGLEQITHDSSFDAFPMFSPDGKKLIFSSNRNNGGTRETNLFIADWVE